MATSAHTSTGLRPYLSPRWPPTTPPSGRARKPTANVANDASTPATGLNSGKNSDPNTRAAATLNTKNSYHSTVAVAAAAPATILRVRSGTASTEEVGSPAGISDMTGPPGVRMTWAEPEATGVLPASEQSETD
ncbi:hypothetical protein ACFQXA_36025 [Nocardiopsis composta]